MKRYRILAAAILIEVLLGFQYTWAIFDRILQETYGLPATKTQLVFSIQIVAFALSFVIAGRILERIGPRITTMIGAVVYGLGLIIGGLGGPRDVTLLGGAGVLLGVGIAFGYIGPIVTAVKWFPNHKGVATGLVVGAFGSGAFFLGWETRLLLAGGFTMFEVFTVLGAQGLVGIALLSFIMVNPPETDARVLARKGTLPAGLLRSGHFWSLVVAFFAGTVAGLSIVGSLEKIGKTLGAPDEWVKVSVMVLAVGNASGRAGWGILVELLGARTAVSVSLALQAVFIVTLILAGHAGPAFVVLAFLIGFNYGGNFVLYVTEVAHKYGPDRVGSVYGIIYVIYVVSGICGPSMAGASFDHWKTYVPSMTVAAAATLAGAGAFLILYRKPVENAL